MRRSRVLCRYFNFATGAINRMKRHKYKIISLLAVFALSVACACMSMVFAAAETTYAPSNVFTVSGASTDSDQGYLAYRLSDGANVYYRKNLALKWYAGEGETRYFTTSFSFGEEYNFETFTMTMETDPFTSGKEGKSSNTLEFTVGADGALDASVNGGEALDVPEVDDGSITVALAENATAGSFTVFVNKAEIGDFTNIGRNYARYASSSADTPITPLAFHAELAEGAENQLFVAREINGQSLATNESNSVTDTEAPVLVINSDIKLLVMGSEIDFDFVAIDVLDSSVSTSRYYYAYDADTPRADLADEEDGSEPEDPAPYSEMDSDKRFFESDFPSLSNEEGLLSVALRLTDGDNSAYYYIEWYASEHSEQGGYSYLRVVEPGAVDTLPEYNFDDATLGDYRSAVAEAAVGEDGESIQVGTGAYYYIPSLQMYIDDATCGYTDMTFDLYYRTTRSDTQSSTGLAYDELRIELTDEGVYEFRIIPVNYLGNALEGVIDGEPVASVSTSNVWELTNVPTFSFSVKYNGISIEEPDDAEDGYLNVTYTFDEFTVTALSNSFTSPVEEYKLYYLVVNSAYEGEVISAEDLRAALLSKDEDGTCTYGTWVEISADDEENEYAESWTESSLSFVPKTLGYFGVTLRAYDNKGEQTAATVVNVTSRADTLPGETYWLRNNVLSVVFICIGGACLIGIVVLLLIKPKDKKAKAVDGAADAEDDLKTKRKNRK